MVTDEQVEELRQEAYDAGDFKLQQLCDRALQGDAGARVQCGRWIEDAKAAVESYR